MERIRNSKTRHTTAIIISLIITLVLSAVAVIIAGSLIKHEKQAIVAVATILIGLATACLAGGVALTFIGKSYRSKVTLTAGILLLFFTLISALIACVLFFMKWWIALLIAIIALPIPLLAILLVYRSNLQVVFENEKSTYVDYKTRKQQEQENPQEEEEELPEIKSFK